MAENGKNSLAPAIRNSMSKVDAALEQAEPLVEKIRSGEAGAEFVDEVNKFLKTFDEVRISIDALPVKDGKFEVPPAPGEREEAMEMFPDLIDRISVLAEHQLLIIETLQQHMTKNKKDMKVIRDSKEIFNKFLKKPEKEPRFFDKKG